MTFNMQEALADRSCLANATIAEAETFLYAGRSNGPAQMRIFRIMDSIGDAGARPRSLGWRSSAWAN